MRSALQPIAFHFEVAEVGGPRWIHLLPAGAFRGKDGRGPYRVESVQAVIEETRRRASGRDIPIDYDHSTDFGRSDGRPKPAAGWITAFEARADGLWGRVEWTERAAEHLKAREYRYISPVIVHDTDGRVLRIARAGLTNNPNLELTALASAEEDVMSDDLSELRTLLGLPADADLVAITARASEVLTSKASAGPDPAKFVPMTEFAKVTAELHALRRGASAESAAVAVDEAIREGKLMPSLREWGVSLCSSDREAFDAFVSKMVPVLHSRPLIEGLPRRGGHGLTDCEREVSAAMGMSADEFTKYSGDDGDAG
ncbi:MAG: hypothetical protein KC466_08570 [Myxococcales bacterium]|nr:hypothetical protein [Myxococcales bacterium]